MDLKNLPEILFVSADKEEVEAYILGEYERIAGRTLARGDPVRLFLLTIAAVIILLLDKINETGKQNLLRYAGGDNLEHLGALVGVERIQATAAVTTMQINLSVMHEGSTVIPAGTRFSAGDDVFFALQEPLVIKGWAQSGEAEAVCLTPGLAGNGYLPGQIKTLVDPLPYVDSVVNITASEGGSGVQDDDSYRENIRLAPESFSVAGPDGAYIYHAKSASAQIIDVSVRSPTPGEVEVRPLLAGGEIPGEEMLGIVLEKLDDRRVRPLTDKVTVLAPEAVGYDVELTYYIDMADTTQAEAIQAAVDEAVDSYVLWQKSRLGRDLNPSELIRRIMQAGAKRVEVASPAFTRLQSTQVAVADKVAVNLGGFEDE